MTNGSNNNSLMLGVLLIGGAFLYARRASAMTPAQAAAAAAARGPLGTGSMPGSVGTGVAQTLGGLLGNLLSPKGGGGTSTGAPPTNSALGDYPPMAGDGVLNNSIPDADPMGTFDPTQGASSWSDSLGEMFA
jgi:hypothetical protein